MCQLILTKSFGYISGVFEKSIVDKVIDNNPCKYVDLPIYKQYCKETKRKSPEERTLSSKEKKILMEKITKSQNPAKYAAEFAFFTGMRVGELSSLRWDNVDFVREVITVQSSEKYNRLTREYYISTTKR